MHLRTWFVLAEIHRAIFNARMNKKISSIITNERLFQVETTEIICIMKR